MLQLSEPKSLEPTVEPHGFKLVEEDDVAFSLGLCREIQRIYSSYHEGTLTPSDCVRDGLTLSLEMVTLLTATVTEGMPALRLEVASAQAREMVAVLFGMSSADRNLIASQARRKLTRMAAPGWGDPGHNPAGLGSGGAPKPPTKKPRARESIFARLSFYRQRRLAASSHAG